MKGLDEHIPNQLKCWCYDVIWWRNNVKSSKRTCLPPESMYSQMRGCKSTHARMWGMLLQDTVSPLGDMLHYLAKLAFWKMCYSVCLGFFFCILQKLAFCKICYSVCLFVWFFYVIIFAQRFLAKYVLHLYNVSCMFVTVWRELHWWHQFKAKVKGQGHMVKVGSQRNPYFWVPSIRSTPNLVWK
jgi:hypothetical protein